jgi:hypothetical protein
MSVSGFAATVAGTKRSAHMDEIKPSVGRDTKAHGDRLPEANDFATKERWGYVVWGIVGAFIAIPEILAALSKTLNNGIPWPTISATIGHLESRWDLVAVGVVALIVIVAVRAVVYPWPVRGPSGRAKRQR